MVFLNSLIVLQLFGYLVNGYSNESVGDVNIVVIFSECGETQENSYVETQMDSASWIIDRLNLLDGLYNLTIGLEFRKACSNDDYFEVFLDLFRNRRRKYVLGVISEVHVPDDVRSMANTLKINMKHIVHDSYHLVHTSIQLLERLNWIENVTVFLPDDEMVDELFGYSRSKSVCIKDTMVYTSNSTYNFNGEEFPYIIFGDGEQISNFLNENELLKDLPHIIAPIDGLNVDDLGGNSYIILPAHIPLTDSSEKIRLTPSPLLFEIAQPILTYTEFLRMFLKLNCNDTHRKLDCLKGKKFIFSNGTIEYNNDIILRTLKIEPLKNNFVYDVYKAENESEDAYKVGYDFKQPLSKIYTYNIFDDVLTSLYESGDGRLRSNFCMENIDTCLNTCENFRDVYKPNHNHTFFTLKFSTDPWVLVFLAISALGILIGLFILTFLFFCIYREDVFEGNPVTTVLILLTIILMYCSILPFSLETNPYNQNMLCLLRSLSTTFSICGAFSLILSRCILLSTVTKEFAYMSHIPGSVQAFLVLFINGIQAALNLITLGNCQKLFTGKYFLYIMSYNAMLLLMILCLCPMIYKSQRNYREGKYFTISAGLIVICWCFWISCYRVLDDTWKYPLICFANTSTATILLLVVFVPRTYLMTISSGNKMKNTVPSTNERNGVLNVYRADARQVYDCVNVAALSAISAPGIGITTTDLDDDIYNYPTLPRDEDLNFEIQTNSSTLSDKVTRF